MQEFVHTCQWMGDMSMRSNDHIQKTLRSDRPAKNEVGVLACVIAQLTTHHLSHPPQRDTSYIRSQPTISQMHICWTTVLAGALAQTSMAQPGTGPAVPGAPITQNLKFGCDSNSKPVTGAPLQVVANASKRSKGISCQLPAESC